MLNPLNTRPQTAAILDFLREVYFSQFGPIQDFYERLSVNIDQNRLFVAQVQNSIPLIFCSLITLNE